MYHRILKKHKFSSKITIKMIILNKIRFYCTQIGKKELDTAYKPHKVESININEHYFNAKKSSDRIFSLVLPPPNITGTLHLGHALTATIQDVIVRWKRMNGVETMWIPGIDHAGIATQVVVEKRLWKENQQTRHDVGREIFEELVWKWKREKADVIAQQLRRLDVALDWPRQVFTMDPMQSRAVTEAFIKLFDKGLIYRADYLVNWSCTLQSAISDIEVEQLEIDGPTKIPVPGYSKSVEFGVLTHFAYKIVDSDEEIVVATTRPETMLGDVAVAVNPKDDRYTRQIGRNLWHPFRKQTIPIICDEFVDPKFGTGAVKVTPAHDHIDFEVGKRHALDILKVIDEKGNLNTVCGEFSGVRRFDARTIIVSELERLQLLRGRQNHRMIVPICSRSKDVVEFLVKPQWFVKCSEMARKAIDDVKAGKLTIEPKHFDKIWFNWLENIRDWCVSRQLWWGHRVPAYLCHLRDQPQKVWVAAENADAARCKAAAKLSTTEDKIAVQQDEDVLDTWFSSALQPFSVFGWPQKNDDLSKYYPLSLMETGHDIIFFWVARMVMLGSELTGKLPFDKILLHGIICDAQGRKMSKSLGNVVAPEDVISGSTLPNLEEASKANYEAGILSSEELKRAIQGQKKMFPEGIPECGADALRFTLLSHNIKNHFIHFDVQECYTNKLFCNKIWQATKFANIWVGKVSETQDLENAKIQEPSLMDRWILSKLANMEQTTTKIIDNYDFHIATAAIKNFLYYNFCDVYLEATKRGLRATNSEIAASHCWTLVKSLDTSLRALSPFMPRLAQHLHRHLAKFPPIISQQSNEWRNEKLEEEMENVLGVVIGVRRLKKIFRVTVKDQPEVCIVSNLSLYEKFREVIEDLALCHKVNVISQADKALIKNTVTDNIGGNTRIYLTVSEQLRQAVQADLPKLQLRKEKLIKELQKCSEFISKSKASEEANIKKMAVLREKIDRIDYIRSVSK